MKIIPIFVPHAGCPNACVFCNQRKIAGKSFVPDAKFVSNEIRRACTVTDGPFQVAFYGGSFTAVDLELQRSLLCAVQPFLADGTVTGVRVSTRPDAIDDGIVAMLREYGVELVELGVQSMVDEVLIRSKRGHSAKTVEKAVDCLKRNGMNFILQMMVGLPGDSAEGAVMTAKRIAELQPNGVRVYPLVVIEDTELAELWRAGKYRALSPEEAAEICASIADVFDEYHIPIIRMGLNPSEELSHGGAVAGAYHPAFGQLVESKRMLHAVENCLKSDDYAGKTLLISVEKGKISDVIGQHGCNRETLIQKFGFASVRVNEADEFRVEIVE